MHELPAFEIFTPSTLAEALTCLSAEGRGSRLLAGGTWLVPSMVKSGMKVKSVVDLSGLTGLRYVRKSQKTIRIGGLTTIGELAGADILDDRYGCFKGLGYHFGVEATRNMATVGGNLAADVEGDLVEILMALDGRVIIQSASGERAAEPAGLGLADDEVIIEVRFPELEGRASTWFSKFEKRKENGRGIATATTLLKLKDDRTVEDVRIAVSRAKGKKTGRALRAESALRGGAADEVAIGHALDTLESELEPTGDWQGSSQFRRKVTGAIVKEGLTGCLEQLQGNGGRWGA